MNIESIRSDEIYKKIMLAPADKKEDIYRYELMKSFEDKWKCYNIPLKATTPGGYDIIIASDMLGFLPPRVIDETQSENIAKISDNTLWEACEKSIALSFDEFKKAGISLPVNDYKFSILLANPENEYTILSKGYCGDGGIPGYILSWLTPNDYTVSHLPVAVAHEANHNVRFQFIKWHNDITLGEMIVSEGIAENFAAHLFGEDKAGPWITSTSKNDLNEYIKPLILDGIGTQGLCELNAYLYGDEIANLQGYEPVGLPWCAGYACGYFLIKHYLEKTGKTITEATLLSADEILSESKDFWTSKTL